jgi:hypothetical protein
VLPGWVLRVVQADSRLGAAEGAALLFVWDPAGRLRPAAGGAWHCLAAFAAPRQVVTQGFGA